MNRLSSPAFVPPPSFDEYELVRPLGAGAIGTVYLARDTLLERLVAVKFLSALSLAADARERMLLEARAIARLSHPNVVAVHRVGFVGERPYIVSEYVRGRSLDTLQAPLGREELERLAVGLARGLAAAHARGVLHRDVKPANALLRDDGDVTLVDFGLAKLLDVGASAGPRSRRSPAMAPELERALDATLTLHPSSASRGATHADGEAHDGNGAATRTNGLVGTPRYMAPEVWAGEPATARADVYSLGAVLYELAVGAPPHEASTLAELSRVVLGGEIPPVGSRRDDLPPALAAIVDRCLARAPETRFESAEALLRAIEEAIAPPAPQNAPEGNPYRGLHPFDAEHASVFFGRASEVRDVLEVLRASSLVAVAGDSGAGKSSLLRAGVLPAIARGARGDGRTWTLVTTTPGRQPSRAIVLSLARAGAIDEADAARFAAAPEELARELVRAFAARKGLVLVVDQLEEAATLAPASEAAWVGDFVRALSGPPSGVLVAVTVRGDFLTRVLSATGLEREVARALYVLGPLRHEGLRDAIVGPARAKGYTVTPAARVDALVASIERTRAALPLLQFAMAEQWERRDDDARTVRVDALLDGAGLSGVLARYADDVIERLLPEQRACARRLFGALVTPDGTRAERTAGELAANDEPAASTVEALVRARLLVARAADASSESTFEIAHEALLTSWDTLRAWLAGDAESRATHDTVTRAAAEWERSGRRADALWSARRLHELATLDAATLGDREQAFVRASRRSVRVRRASVVLAALAIPLAASGALVASRVTARRALDARVAVALRDARDARAVALASAAAYDATRARAMAAFDARRRSEAEATWDEAKSLAETTRASFTRALAATDAALALDERRRDVRALTADTLLDAALFADRERRFEPRDALVARLEAFDDDGSRRRALAAPATLTIQTAPAGARLRLEAIGHGPRRPVTSTRDLGAAPAVVPDVAPGEYRIVADHDGRVEVVLPILVARGAAPTVTLRLPDASQAPRDFVYVPAGEFLFGADGDEGVRQTFYDTAPLHTVRTEAYWIARHETTFAEWIAYLRAVPEAERARRTPRGSTAAIHGALELREQHGRYALTIQPNARAYHAEEGEPIVYEARDRRKAQDWRTFPASGITWDDVLAYAAWLDATGRVRGARACTEHEWERAARGADGRIWPHGDRLEPDDANYDATYGKEPLAFGPDAVGAHPASRSPFGVDDLAGNVWEWVTSSLGEQQYVVRGGSYYFGSATNPTMNRNVVERGMRDPTAGARICATPDPNDQ